MVFISYSSKDREIADYIKEKLENAEIECWMAPKSIRPSSDYMTDIPDAIEKSEVLLVLVSTNAQNSEWVSKEVGRAISHSKVILPLKIENVPLRESFKLLFENIQMLDAYENLDKAFEKMIPVIKEKEKITENVFFETSFSHKKDKGNLIIRSADRKKNIYDFTEEKWGEFVKHIIKVASIVSNVEEDSIFVYPIFEFGKLQCVPADKEQCWKEPGVFNFSIDYQTKNKINKFYFFMNRGKLEISIFVDENNSENVVLFNSKKEEQDFINILTDFFEFMNNGRDNTSVDVDEQFGYKSSPGLVKYTLEYRRKRKNEGNTI